jgi:hypothetical protein
MKVPFFGIDIALETQFACCQCELSSKVEHSGFECVVNVLSEVSKLWHFTSFA